MKVQLYITLFISILLVVTGCKTQKKMLSVTELNGEWSLVELKDNSVNTEESRQFLVFDVDKKQYSGNAGCNRMSGELGYDEKQPGMLTFGRALTTRMACPALESEQMFLAAMQEVVRFEPDSANRIAFFDKNDTKLFVIQNK